MVVLWGGPFDGQDIDVGPHAQALRLPMISQATPIRWAESGMAQPTVDIALYSRATSGRFVFAGMEHVR